MELETHTPRTRVAFDTEGATRTGAPHLVEVGAVRFVDGEAIEHFQRLVCPLVPIDPEATAIHGIVDEDVRAAGDARAVLEEFFAWIGTDPLVAHNARSDAAAIGFECARHGLTPPPNPVLDTLALARRMIPESDDHRLATLAEHLELDLEDTHRALPDAVACWQVFEACVERMGGVEAATPARLFELAGVPLTLATSLPARPSRRPSQLRILERAQREDATVILTYGEDDAPARIEVSPRLLFRREKRGYLEAECMSSGLLKTYRLDRIQRVTTP